MFYRSTMRRLPILGIGLVSWQIFLYCMFFSYVFFVHFFRWFWWFSRSAGDWMTWILEVFFLELGKNEDLENVDCWIEVLEKKHSFDIVAYLAPGIKVFIFRFYTMSPCFYQWFPAKHCTFPRLWNRCPGRADKSRSVAGAVDLFSWLFTPERKTLPGFGPNCARGAADNTYCMSEKLAGSDICLIISA